MNPPGTFLRTALSAVRILALGMVDLMIQRKAAPLGSTAIAKVSRWLTQLRRLDTKTKTYSPSRAFSHVIERLV
jgi:hypothetical protein